MFVYIAYFGLVFTGLAMLACIGSFTRIVINIYAKYRYMCRKKFFNYLGIFSCILIS